MGRSNGIGAQFVQLVAGASFPWRHYWWETWDHMPSDPEASILLTRRLLSDQVSRLWPFEKGRSRIASLLPPINLPGAAWQGAKLRDGTVAGHFGPGTEPFDVALVAPISEGEAEHTLSVLDVLRCPYVFQVWDIMHSGGLDPAEVPSFVRLLRGAAQVLALTPAIADEIKRVHAGPVELMAFGREPADPESRSSAAGSFRLAVLGFLVYYHDGVRLLANAWRNVRTVAPNAKLVVIGREDQLRFLPDSVRDDVEFHAYPKDAERDRLLASCDAAFLPGPLSASTALGRFSVPCRIADYLHLGLPIVGAVAASSATVRFLAPIKGKAFFPAEDAEQLAEALGVLATPSRRAAASEGALAFAREHLNIMTIRPRLLNILEAAAAGDRIGEPPSAR